MEVSGQLHPPGERVPGCPSDTRRGWPQSRYGQMFCSCRPVYSPQLYRLSYLGSRHQRNKVRLMEANRRRYWPGEVGSSGNELEICSAGTRFASQWKQRLPWMGFMVFFSPSRWILRQYSKIGHAISLSIFSSSWNALSVWNKIELLQLIQRRWGTCNSHVSATKGSSFPLWPKLAVSVGPVSYFMKIRSPAELFTDRRTWRN
jgi:hypothetical protein